jgi:hypothetical protein
MALAKIDSDYCEGEAVGIQVMVQGEIAWIHSMNLVMKYFHDHYDGSLRFLTPSDIP